jgi:16S rRNA C967 or C1407 C5-methylase (RsmB/RsmF family)/NOL1/NOP2/fmu family ribosome biogenesis protein
LQEYKIPLELTESLKDVPGFDKAAFENVHESGKQVTSVRINPFKTVSPPANLPIAASIPWSQYGYYLTERPSFTFDPIFHAGAYYVQEASSMLLEQALKQLVNLEEPIKVLDLCAAPGGKSTHIQSLISPDSVLVTNEVIRNRVNILAENITKWGAVNAIVTNNDPADFTRLEEMFDVIVVDAPCSGSGLFRKDPEAIEEWSLENVAHCSLRQKRILNDIWPSLKPGGILIYATCSYSIAEDEYIADWLTTTNNAVSLKLRGMYNWQVIETQSPVHNNIGYRCFPYLLNGEGFYLACFKKEGEPGNSYVKQVKYQADKKLEPHINKWLQPNHELQIYQHKEQVFAMPKNTLDLFMFLQSKLNIRKAGVKIGDYGRDEIIPDHALILSTVYNKELTSIPLENKAAINYLRRADFIIDQLPKGWLIVTYENYPLGWIKSLGNRFNNYYPKEWRIRN